MSSWLLAIGLPTIYAAGVYSGIDAIMRGRNLQEAGITTAVFSGGCKAVQKFPLNIRNHRKIVVADGRVAFVGGLNWQNIFLRKRLHASEGPSGR